jgi:chaperonin GroES
VEISMNVRPLYDRVIVKRLEAEEKTAGGLFIPDTAKEKPIQGQVMAVGNGKRTDKGEVLSLEVKVNDRVLFGKYSGTEIKLDGQERVILREDEILAIVDA